MKAAPSRYSVKAKRLHLGLALFGIGALLTGEWAEHGSFAMGYQIHAYLGLAQAGCLLIRVIFGLLFNMELSFKGWAPLSRSQLQTAWTDVKTIGNCKLPERARHSGLAGLLQAFGLVIFGWMAITGTALYYLNENVLPAAFELLEEMHEAGQSLLIIYLLLHIGAVLLHAISGKPIWKNMFGPN